MRGLYLLHLRKEWPLLLFPAAVIYGLLLPVQSQILSQPSVSTEELMRICGDSQRYLLLFAVWNMYPAFRLLLSRELKEATDGSLQAGRIRWGILFQGFYLLGLSPYLLWLYRETAPEGFGLGAALLPLQTTEMALLTVFFMLLLQSAPGGMAAAAGWHLYSFGGLPMPDVLRTGRVGIPAAVWEKNWYLCRFLCITFFLAAGSFLEKRKAVR
ncbi:MAG TPA: hypothetical protein IAB71_04280 [Candidatus Scatomonas pullistercoris]|uniref:Uncharacterized protein n=1 Tax=Candidatus Scatomonas pullistercoris TaxID=2840920 RepID=A0A9D1P314_9FIRM|nr:hypothetical protein [Candidatus Scatomonas pullistercoris]